jgi:hypothetical protein
MANSPNWQDQEDLTQPPSYFQVRKPTHSPGPGRSADLSLGLFFDSRNRIYLVVAICGLVALTAFFMPYFTVSTVVSNNPTFLNIPLAQSTPLPTAGSDAANGFALLWSILVVAVAVMTMTAILVLDTGSLPPTTTIIGAVIFLAGGLLGVIALIGSLFRANSDIAQANQLLSQHSITRYHVILGIGLGFWLTLLAMIFITILGGINLRRVW